MTTTWNDVTAFVRRTYPVLREEATCIGFRFRSAVLVRIDLLDDALVVRAPICGATILNPEAFGVPELELDGGAWTVREARTLDDVTLPSLERTVGAVAGRAAVLARWIGILIERDLVYARFTD